MTDIDIITYLHSVGAELQGLNPNLQARAAVLRYAKERLQAAIDRVGRERLKALIEEIENDGSDKDRNR